MKLTVTLCVMLIGSLPQINAATAETIVCDSGNVQCLIDALRQANADPHRTTIRLAGGTYLLTSADNDTDGPNALPSITTPVTIDGGGAILERMSGSPFFRILHVGPSGDLSLNGVTVTGGQSSRGGNLFNGGAARIRNSVVAGKSATEGGVLNDHGTLSIIDSTFERNGGFSPTLSNVAGVVNITRTMFDGNIPARGTVTTDGGKVHISGSRFSQNSTVTGPAFRLISGEAAIVQTTFDRNSSQGVGAIVVEQGNLIVLDSAFVDNGGFNTGGILVNPGGTAYVSNTTFFRNRAGVGCNGAPAIHNFGTLTIVNSTVAANVVHPSCAFRGTLPAVGVEDGSTLVLQNSIVFNTDPLVQDCSGVFTSLGHNLIGNLGGCGISVQLTDRIGEARLGAFNDDGTPGNAHVPLLADSPAIDAANSSVCPKRDQIGQRRGRRCDIGAIEFRQADTP